MDKRGALSSELNEYIGSLRQYIAGERFFSGGMSFAAHPRMQKPPLSKTELSEKQGMIKKLRQEVSVCERCGLHAGRAHAVFGEGSLQARLLFIGEAPGQEEDETGRPFVGEAGQLLTKIIQAMKLRREDVYITNMLHCRPPDNRNPEPGETEQCRPFLLRLIKIIQPEIICALGSFASHALLPDAPTISRLRGTWQRFEGVPLMPTFHPAYLLRSPVKKKLVWEDMKKIMLKLADNSGVR